jgi:hypothetical protein
MLRILTLGVRDAEFPLLLTGIGSLYKTFNCKLNKDSLPDFVLAV